jgi:large subunit ribosomal protein L10
MDNPRAEKVAVVDEVKERLSAADATVLTDYRGIDVPGMAQLRRSLREAGGDVKIYKNTLVRFAAKDLGLEIDDMLIGPTALAFVEAGEDGTGDPVLVAKALRDFAKTNDNLEIKGGLLGDRLLTAAEVDQLAQIAPRDELLARFAGGLAAPLQKMAGLLEALPRNLAYGIAALIDDRGGPVAAEAPAEAADEAEVADEAEAPAAEAETDAPADDSDTETDAPVADAEADADVDTAEPPADETAAENAEEPAAADASDSTDEAGATEDPASEDSESDSDSEEG